MISITSVPGGNPAAKADPEGFASEWTFCGSCRGYTCDRCLGKQHGRCRCGNAVRLLSEPERIEIANALAQGRAPSVGAGPIAQPSGAAAFNAAMGGGAASGAAAFNAAMGGGAPSGAAAFNAAMGGGAAPASAPTPSGAAPAAASAQRIGPKLKVCVRGTSFAWPAACVCCAERTDRTKRITDSVTQGRMRYSTSWDVPCCQACDPHLTSFRPKFSGLPPKERDPEKIVRTPMMKIAGVVWSVLSAVATGLVLSLMARREMGEMGSIAAGVLATIILLPILFGWSYFTSGRKVEKERAAVRKYNDTERENAAARDSFATNAKPTCTHTGEGAFSYWRSQSGTEHTFSFARRDLAMAFKQANAALVVSSDV